MYEIDFLPVENEEGGGAKSGDAISIRFTEGDGRQRVVVVDGGFSSVGEDLAKHIEKYYEASYVDLVISTHPDADHLNGLVTALDKLSVGELMIHQPSLHVRDISKFSNLET